MNARHTLSISSVLSYSSCGLESMRQNVRDVFDNAGSAAPCVLFL